MDQEAIDEEHIPELITEYRESGRTYERPIVIQWQDTGEYEIIPEPYLTDGGWSDKERPRRVVGTLEELEDYYGVLHATTDGNAESTSVVMVCPRCKHAWIPRVPRPKKCHVCQYKFEYQDENEKEDN